MPEPREVVLRPPKSYLHRGEVRRKLVVGLSNGDTNVNTPPDATAPSAPHQRAAEGDNVVIDGERFSRHVICGS